MNVLDENILESQRQLLRSWGIAVRQIGVELARKGISDADLIPFLLTLSFPTFFTRDLGFAARPFCHTRYCLVILAVGQYEVAHFARRVLRHPSFNTSNQRMGTVIKVMPVCLSVWRVHGRRQLLFPWQ